MSPSQNKAAMQAHIPQWQASSLTQAGYCKIHNIKPHIFSYYKKQFVTPAERHEGKDRNILEMRDRLYLQKKEESPSRWPKSIRN